MINLEFSHYRPRINDSFLKLTGETLMVGSRKEAVKKEVVSAPKVSHVRVRRIGKERVEGVATS